MSMRQLVVELGATDVRKAVRGNAYECLCEQKQLLSSHEELQFIQQRVKSRLDLPVEDVCYG